eukprot:3269015-Heterocapsa_arctica.AAC.1
MAFSGLIRLKEDHSEDDVLGMVMANLPANRLWTTVAFSGLGHILFLTKHIHKAPGPEDIISRIIAQAATESTWEHHAKEWLER